MYDLNYVRRAVFQRRLFDEDKWHLSERMLRDAGKELAEVHWLDAGYAKWFGDTFERYGNDLLQMCESLCGNSCPFLENTHLLFSSSLEEICKMPKTVLHGLLRDDYRAA